MQTRDDTATEQREVHLKFYFVSFIVMVIAVSVGTGAYYQGDSSIMVIIGGNDT